MRYKKIPLVNPAPSRPRPRSRVLGMCEGAHGAFPVTRGDIGGGSLRFSPDRTEVWAEGLTIGRRVRPKKVVGEKAQRTNPSKKESTMRLARNRKGQFVKKARSVKKNTAKRPLSKMGKEVTIRMGRKKVTARKLRPTIYSRPGMGIFATTRSAVKGMKINPSRRRRYKPNPGIVKSIKQTFSKQMLTSAAATLLGFLGGRYIGKQIASKLPLPTSLAAHQGTIVGLLQLVLGGVVASKGKKPLVKAAAIGVAASGVEAVLRSVAPTIFSRLEGEGIVPIEAQIPWSLPSVAGDGITDVGAQFPWDMQMGEDLSYLGRYNSDY